MNKYKRISVKLRKDYVWSQAISFLHSPDLPEYLMEDLWHVMAHCSSLTIIKFLWSNNLLTIRKVSSLLGVSVGDLCQDPLYRKIFYNGILEDSRNIDYESLFGV